MATWSAPVRYAEVDQQGIVFNSHYLLYCDEAMSAFCAQRELPEFVELVRLVATSLTWTAPARWGDVIDVDARCTKVGRTSATLAFDLRASGEPCCLVETTYVYTDKEGTPQPIPDDVRAQLMADQPLSQPG
jgi:acyl-CoA thioester hydrolase